MPTRTSSLSRAINQINRALPEIGNLMKKKMGNKTVRRKNADQLISKVKRVSLGYISS